MADAAGKRLAILQSLTARLAKIRDEPEVADLVLGQGVAELGGSTGSLCLVSADGRHLEIVAERGYPIDVTTEFRRFPLDAPLPASEAVRTGEPVFLTSATDRDTRYPVFKETPVVPDESSAIVPLVADEDAAPLGTLVIGFRQPRDFDDADRRFLEALAAQCANALARSRLYDRLRFIADASVVLASDLDLDRTLARVTGLASPRLSDWSALYLIDDRGGVTLNVTSDGDTAKLAVAKELGQRLPDDPEPAAYPDLASHLGVDALTALPMHARGARIGLLALINEAGRPFGEDDFALGVELANRAAVAIENARLFSERTLIARSLQDALLPPALPEIPGLELAATYAAAGHGIDAGGDFYDAFPAGDGRWVVAIGDVCGKGPEAAAITGVVRHAIRAAGIGERSPAAILRHVHAVLVADQPVTAELEPRFCTAIAAVIEPSASRNDGRTVVVACAGHPLPLVRRADGTVEAVGAPGSALGLPEVGDAVDREVRLDPGDALALFTDGITERHDDNHYFGVEGVAAVMSRAGVSASSVVSAIDHAALSFIDSEPHDDMAALVIARPPLQRARLKLDPEPQSASAARRFVTTTLEQWGCHDLVEDAALSTSELVTNAALHARTQIEVRIHRMGDRVRIGVLDTNSAPLDPVLGGGVTRPVDAPTGRGLQIVAHLADRWGIVTEAFGKLAWFELGAHRAGTADGEISDPGALRKHPESGFIRVALTDVPVRLVLASELHLSGVVREAQLAIASGGPHPVAKKVRAILDAYSGSRNPGAVVARAAAARGDLLVTINNDVPRELIEEGGRFFLELLDTTDELCRSGALLSLPASPDVRAFRAWCIEETIRQVNGAEPQPYPC